MDTYIKIIFAICTVVLIGHMLKPIDFTGIDARLTEMEDGHE